MLPPVSLPVPCGGPCTCPLALSSWPTLACLRSRYGPEAGHATDNAVNSAINVGVTAFNVENLGIKAVVKKTGKQTAQAILEEYKVQEKPGPDLEKKEWIA